jgi:hypothetical protein
VRGNRRARPRRALPFIRPCVFLLHLTMDQRRLDFLFDAMILETQDSTVGSAINQLS